MIKVDEILGSDQYKHPFFSDTNILKIKGMKEAIVRLSKPNVWASLGQILFEYIIIAGVIAFNIVFPNPWLYPLSVIIIGCRFHALFIIMHDGAHFKISKNKKVNEIITHVLIAFPLFANLNDWRRAHFAHHRNPNSDEDPDWVAKLASPDYTLPKKLKEFLKILIEHMFGLKMIVTLFSPHMTIKEKIKYFSLSFKSPTQAAPPIDGKEIQNYTPKQQAIIALGYIAVIAVLIYLKVFGYFILFWVLPMVLWTHFATKIRSYSEHFGLPNENIYDKTRTMYASWFDKMFLGYSWNVGLHLDHHLFPGVPSYRLNKLHKILKNFTPYSKYAHITKNGIFGVIKECTT